MTTPITPPTIPTLPTQPAPTLDWQLQHAALHWRAFEHAQRERHEAAWAARHTADMAQRATAETRADQRLAEQVRITTALATAYNRAAAAMEYVNTNGIPTDQPMADAINALREVIASLVQPGVPGAAPGAVSGLDALVTLVSTMTSAERRNPAAAAAAARAQLAAITTP